MQHNTDTEAVFTINGVQLSSVQPTSLLEAKVTELFKLLQQPLLRYLTGIVCSQSEAEELAQETFLALYRTLRKREEIRNCRAWVFRVAHNLAINSQKKRSQAVQLGQPESQQLLLKCIDPNEDAEQQLLLKERQLRVKAALVILTQQEHRCLALRAEGLRFREIADVLGVRTSTVETFIERSMRKIMKKLYD